VDRDLVERARLGDREAFAVLVHQVSDTLSDLPQGFAYIGHWIAVP
jgi:hypothetical protein